MKPEPIRRGHLAFPGAQPAEAAQDRYDRFLAGYVKRLIVLSNVYRCRAADLAATEIQP